MKNFGARFDQFILGKKTHKNAISGSFSSPKTFAQGEGRFDPLPSRVQLFFGTCSLTILGCFIFENRRQRGLHWAVFWKLLFSRTTLAIVWTFFFQKDLGCEDWHSLLVLVPQHSGLSPPQPLVTPWPQSIMLSNSELKPLIDRCASPSSWVDPPPGRLGFQIGWQTIMDCLSGCRNVSEWAKYCPVSILGKIFFCNCKFCSFFFCTWFFFYE